MASTVNINGKNLPVPKDFFDVEVKAAFGENIQSNLTTDQFTFILEAYTEIINWIKQGRRSGVGIFEGIPIKIINENKNLSRVVFEGIIDLQQNTVIQENLKQVSARLRQKNNLNQLSDLLEPLDFGYLRSVGTITDSDFVKIEYVVNPPDNGFESIVTFVTIFLLSAQIADTVKNLAEVPAISGGIAVAGIGGPAGATIYAIAVTILQVAFAATLIVLIIDFGNDLFNSIVQPVREHKGIALRTLIEKTCQHIGYSLETTIDEINNLVFLPSNLNLDEFGPKNILKRPGSVEIGTPNATDPGYTCTDLFEIAKDLFNARFAIVGNTVQFHSENSDYWTNQSSYKKPSSYQDVDQRQYRYNTEDLFSSYFITFATDATEQYTIKNFKGTSYQVLTDAKTISIPENKTIKNAERVAIPWALGSRKNELNFFEKSLLPLANLFDEIGDLFGDRPGLAKKIRTKVGVLEVSNNNHSVPKLLYLQGGRIPKSQRNLFSAKTLWEKYHIEKSFVANGFQRQRRVIENEIIPFGLSDFVKLLNNSYFKDENGKTGKITDITWNMAEDKAQVSYWVPEVYTRNLIETFIEPE